MNAKEYYEKSDKWSEGWQYGTITEDMIEFAEEYHQLKSKEEATELINTINKQCKTYFIQTDEYTTDSAYLKADVIETIWNSTGKIINND